MTVSDTPAFYDDLANLHHLIYEDWPASIERQGDALSAIIRAHDPSAVVVADVACGIGTQALGLAARGYQVIGSDVSAGAIARLKREATERELQIDVRFDDMLELRTYAKESVDVLLACDNAVPHLLTDDDIRKAFHQFHRVIRSGGLCIISVRDYAAMPPTKVRFVPYGVREVPGGRVTVFQTWDYEQQLYRFGQYFVFDYGDRIETRVFRARYYAVSIDTLCRLFAEAGFRNVRRIDDALFQPVITAERPRTA